MKVRYSNKIKHYLSISTISEIVLIAFSTVPQQTKHIFTFEKKSKTKICLIHYVPISNEKTKIYLKHSVHCKLPQEPIILLMNNSSIYLFMESEIHLQ